MQISRLRMVQGVIWGRCMGVAAPGRREKFPRKARDPMTTIPDRIPVGPDGPFLDFQKQALHNPDKSGDVQAMMSYE